MLEQEYTAGNRRRYLLIAFTLVIIIVLGVAFTAIGFKQGVMQVLIAVKLYCSGELESSPDTSINKIILLMRLPRIALAILAGIGVLPEPSCSLSPETIWSALLHLAYLRRRHSAPLYALFLVTARFSKAKLVL